MKILHEDYTFNASAKTVTFNNLQTITLEQLLIITNVSTNEIIYNFANPSLGGSVNGNTLSLLYNTENMNNQDRLQIFLDNLSSPATEESLKTIQDQNILLRRMINLIEPLSTRDSANRQRIAVEIMPTTTVTGALTNVSALGGVDSRFQFIDAARLTYAEGIRKHLNFN